MTEEQRQAQSRRMKAVHRKRKKDQAIREKALKALGKDTTNKAKVENIILALKVAGIL